MNENYEIPQVHSLDQVDSHSKSQDNGEKAFEIRKDFAEKYPLLSERLDSEEKWGIFQAALGSRNVEEDILAEVYNDVIKSHYVEGIQTIVFYGWDRDKNAIDLYGWGSKPGTFKAIRTLVHHSEEAVKLNRTVFPDYTLSMKFNDGTGTPSAKKLFISWETREDVKKWLETFRMGHLLEPFFDAK